MERDDAKSQELRRGEAMNPVNVSEDTIVQEIAIKSPAERIFAAWTNPDELVKWWGVEGKFQGTHIEADLRPGGRWRMRVAGGAGRESTWAGPEPKIGLPGLLAFTA